MENKKVRIWELDAARGLFLLGMVAVHLIFDIVYFGGMALDLPKWYQFVKNYGHILFVLISGICVTLGSRSFQRGTVVFGAGLLISYVTLYLDLVMGLSGLRIWFGILHMLGFCMMLYPAFKKIPCWGVTILGIGFVILGAWFRTVTVPVTFLFPLGLCKKGMIIGSDFSPVFPGFGWFLIGAAIGKTAYKNKESLFPRVNSQNSILKFLQFCGRNSLPIYILHQPVLTFITFLLSSFFH